MKGYYRVRTLNLANFILTLIYGLFFNNNCNFYFRILAQSFFLECPRQLAIETGENQHTSNF